jgi:hypothetical protein
VIQIYEKKGLIEAQISLWLYASSLPQQGPTQTFEAAAQKSISQLD